MANNVVHQYAFRAQKQFGLALGAPAYGPLEAFSKPDATVRHYSYSPDGRLLAYVLPTTVQIIDAASTDLVVELPVPNVIELRFSPKGTFLSTWERQQKLEDGTQHKNHRIFLTATGAQVSGFSQKAVDNFAWDVQYTADESRAVRLAGPELQVFEPARWEDGVTDKVRIEGASSIALSPGATPSVAVFVLGKNGAPATVTLRPLTALATPSASKSFFKADRCTVKWSANGANALVLTQTDVDAANKSYYGETGLYILSATPGGADARVGLDKDGPIHDFGWAPNGREFAVVYGFMPAKTVLFDVRVRSVHDFGTAPQNFVSFSPTGRLVALAGFGNLAGKIDVVDRSALRKVCTIDAPNTSHFEWSPCGQFILTATLSPRLRVDNGIKIWHCTGPLLYVHEVEELYQASWRPVVPPPPFPPTLPAAPAPAASVVTATAVGGAASPAPKVAGAYRPPGARGSATPSIYRREDEGGERYVGSPSPGPGRGGPNGHHANGNGHHSPTPGGERGRGRGRVVPGAGPPREREEGQGQGKKKKQGGKKRDDGATPESAPTPPPPPPAPAPEEDAAADGGLDPVAKKIRNLSKKLKAIEELKEKHKRGEKLEATQVKKMEGEAEIVSQLSALQAQQLGA